MKWLNAAFSFVLVTAGVFFVVGWCLLPTPVLEPSDDARADRFRVLAKMDWAHNGWGYLLGPAIGAASAWLTIRQSNRKSSS